MIHKPILIQDLALCFPHKVCFADFSCLIQPGSRIAIIGRNGSGKSCLLNMLRGIALPKDVVIGYVPQIVEDFGHLSGGQRFNEALTQALAVGPNVLLLDEPTNHLDGHNRRSLLRMLAHYAGTLIVVSHDVELLRHVDTLWHIDQGRIHVFSGCYDDYMREMHIQRAGIEHELSRLKAEKKDMHQALMREQQRAAKSRASGEKKMANKRWMQSVGDIKAMRAEKSQGDKRAAIDHKKQELTSQLADLRLPEIIVPKFALNCSPVGGRVLVSISDGCVGYQGQAPILSDICLSLLGSDRLAIVGDNGSGKSSLLKAIFGDVSVIKTGVWHGPQEIGYLDQHYGTLCPHKTVLGTIQELLPHGQVRSHLNDFLFRKNEEVNALVATLSGGEKARLSLAQIAAKPPQLLILDEVTNNLDLETRAHVIQVLRAFPGAMIIVSHDENFLEEVGVDGCYKLG